MGAGREQSIVVVVVMGGGVGGWEPGVHSGGGGGGGLPEGNPGHYCEICCQGPVSVFVCLSACLFGPLFIFLPVCLSECIYLPACKFFIFLVLSNQT